MHFASLILPNTVQYLYQWATIPYLFTNTVHGRQPGSMYKNAKIYVRTRNVHQLSLCVHPKVPNGKLGVNSMHVL